MAKKYLFLVLLISVFKMYSQEGIFYQAKFLRDNYDPEQKQIALKLSEVKPLIDDLKILFKANDEIALQSLINKNPFFESKGIKFVYVTSEASSNGKWSAFSTGAIGNIDVTTAAQGLSQFLIKRAKEELTVAFFNRFKTFSEKNPEFNILFPKTTDKLKNLLTYTYPQMLPALRESFFEDLSTVTLRLDDLLAQPRYEALLKNLPEITICIRSIKIIHQLENGDTNAADALNSFAALPEFSTSATGSATLQNIGCGLKFASIISESLRKDNSDNTKEGEIWAPRAELQKLGTDDVLFAIYMGLIYQKTVEEELKYIKDGENEKFSDVLEKQKDHLFTLQMKISDLTTLMADVDKLISEIHKKQMTGNVSTDDYYNYINKSIGFLESGYQFVNIYERMKDVDVYFAILRKTNAIYKDSYNKQYTLLVDDLFELFKLLDTCIQNSKQSTLEKPEDASELVQQLKDKKKKYNKIKDAKIDAASNSEADPKKKAEITKLGAQYKIQRILKSIDKAKPYALFMANIVEAKNPDDVANALESAALPVGSSSIKKNTHSNFAVQAYLGAFVSDKNNDNSSFNSSFGVIAPVGIAYTPGFASLGQGGSFSVFATLLDIGAIADYDLKREPSATQQNTETVKKDYKVKLGQIFSPGGYIVYGVGGNIPLAVGFGAQYGPGLSKVDDVSGAQVINPSWRASIFLAVDIPLFTLKNSIKENK